MEIRSTKTIGESTHGEMRGAGLTPAVKFVQLGRSVQVPKKVREENHFTIVRLQSPSGLDDRIMKGSAVPALLISVCLQTLPAGKYQLWSDSKQLAHTRMPAFHSNVMDFDASPACWAGSAFDFVHYHLPRGCMDDLAGEWGVAQPQSFREAVVENDLVIAQITKSLLPSITRQEAASLLALDQLQLVLAAHLVQRYGNAERNRVPFKGGLAPWQKRRASELLAEHLDGSIRLAGLAAECGLSVSQFARCFKTTYGVTSHQWLVMKRVERAKELLRRTHLPLIDIAARSGFGDQSVFTRSFRSVAGVSPGRWRRQQGTVKEPLDS